MQSSGPYCISPQKENIFTKKIFIINKNVVPLSLLKAGHIESFKSTACMHKFCFQYNANIY